MEKFIQWSRFRAFLVLILAVSFQGHAQFSTEYTTYKEKYPNARLVRLTQETVVTLEIRNGNIDITQEILEEDLYLDEAATYGSKKALNFSSFFELENIEASSFVYDGNRYKESKVTDFKEKDELEGSFHDDTRSVNFIYSGLSKGGKSRLKYSEKVKNPRFLSPMFLAEFSPIIKNRFTIVADKNINLQFKEFNTAGMDITFSKNEKRGKVTYTWEVGETDEYEQEENAPTYKKILPHIIPVVTSYSVNGNDVNVLGGVEDLYSWYYSLVKDVNRQEDDRELVKLVHELTANKKNDLEKIRAIYYWTQSNIKYIAFEYALGGFIPREANAVFQKKYGDCKDNSSILHKMLSIAGLEGNLTWIGTRAIPYTYSEVPTPLVDNHMILAVVYDGKTYFLDATGRYLPMEFPSSFIQGKEALIANGDSYRIEEVPVMPARANSIKDLTQLELTDGELIGRAKTEISGYNKVDLFHFLESQNSDARIREFYNAMLRKGNNKFLIGNLKEVNKYSYDEDFLLEYDFNVDGYAKAFGDEMYLNLNLNNPLSEYKTPKNRKLEIEFDHKNSFSYTTRLEIPEGYSVDYIPENAAFSNELLSASIDYIVEGNQIIYNHKVELNFLSLDLEQQKRVNDLIQNVEKAYKEIVVLKKTT